VQHTPQLQRTRRRATHPVRYDRFRTSNDVPLRLDILEGTVFGTHSAIPYVDGDTATGAHRKSHDALK
jgi:hypothetical protein